jgi:tetratricopeptide (TPR) repeat protein
VTQRNNSKRFIVHLSTILFLSMTATPLGAQEAPAGEAALTEARELVYSQTGSEEEITALLVEARDAFEDITDPVADPYSMGRVYLLKGTYYNSVDNDRRAAQALEKAIAYAREAVERREFSEGYRLLADAYSQMMMARGIFYMARHGETARDAAFRALELGPENAKAYISVAGYYLNAPPIAGGDTEKGIELLREGINLDSAGNCDRFLMYLWLAEAAEELGREERAADYLEEAREIFPDSPQVASLAKRLE